ncbi:LacI family DNA-binding transcriptional regulator [Humibacter sp.]|jgi:LacI family transcriptional regulator|uniref:LacI family DNA-binding transcriptional regulator n=1 Tax=Humibacter sp. TaxID=1940291 RepID=UPI002C6876BD|nr:LacI family DNA-binding transcriptional regulator [Humibacter sp.]HVX07583.1 LacI family DNA-binding transcriptional regulator [Humibacter sp.]
MKGSSGGDDPASQPARPPTVKDVAERAQVSPMTVSRVLAGGANVRPQLRRRVEHAALELGYRRNENARSLRPGHKSGLIGVTITNIANPYYAEMQGGIEEVAAQANRRIIVGNSNEDPDRERQLVADFIGRRVEGLIVVPADPAHSDHLDSDALGGTPIVFASRPVPGLDVDTVLIDDIGGAYEATSRLLEEGHRQIAFLGTRTSVLTGQRRLQGYRNAHRDRNVPVYEHLIRTGQQEAAGAEKALAELLVHEVPPTAVFSANNRNTLGAIRAIAKFRSAQSQATDLRLIGFDWFEFADLSPVPLSIVAHDPRELGRRAAQMLLARIEGDLVRPAETVELPVELQLEPRGPQ